MELRLKALAESEHGLVELNNCKLPARTSFKVAKVINIIAKEIELFNQAKIKKAEELGDKQDDGTYKIREENIDKFRKEIDELLNTKVDLEFSQINLKELSDVSISPSAIRSLGSILTE
ncbi:MAG: hypothetical protein IPP74_13625 [Alphaproteobacteria bacterium]|nr:hypothetical protein [Alphaproteobacteria bacterium]